MAAGPNWVARAWLVYALAGIGWVIAGAVVLGVPRGDGLVFIGLACLGIGATAALWRVRHGYGLLRAPGR
ncbi:MAG: hypothetical protein M0030_06085 [Actinomycetota bacterium]|jgi:hypothetical protein|nr:hypothetical protein [Actinomycetota bacterium]